LRSVDSAFRRTSGWAHQEKRIDVIELGFKGSP
jgi:hypothetical protein